MQVCPQCGAHYEGGETVCAVDGATLVMLRPSQAIAVDPLLGRRIKDTYLVQARIGAGGMGTVYRAVQERLGRVVALKVLPQHLAESEEAVLRFHREARSASALSHPNTIVIHDYGQEPDGLLYLAMEFVDGRPLSALIRDGNLSPRRILHVLEQVSGSLMEAHAKGMIHRDLKPDNVMLTRRGELEEFVKVLDFGLAKAVSGGEQRDSTITQSGMVMGTPAYMSPEQIQNLPLTAASDQYALGIIAFEMVTGRAPFQGATSLSICMQHVNNEPPRLTDLHPELPLQPQLEAVIRRCLAKEPAERFASVGEFVKELEPFLSSDEWRSGSAMIELASPASSQGHTVRRSPGTGKRSGAVTVGGEDRLRAGARSRGGLVAALLAVLLLAGGGAAAYVLYGDRLFASSEPVHGPASSGLAAATQEAENLRQRKLQYEAALTEGRRLFQAEQLLKSLEQFERAHGLDMKNPAPYQWMGEIHKRRGSLRLARINFEKYLRLSEGELAPSVMDSRLASLLGPVSGEGDGAVEPPAPPTPAGRTGSVTTGSSRPPRPAVTGSSSDGRKPIPTGTKPAIDTDFE